MNKKGLVKFIIIGLLLIGIIFYFVFNNSETSPNSNGIKSDRSLKQNSLAASEKNEVIITEQGFSPGELQISAGEEVVWINFGKKKSWPASDLHPTHLNYPNSDIKKCKTEDKTNIFDACRGLLEGESWSFKFNDGGTWEYHDHLNAELRGTIIVE